MQKLYTADILTTPLVVPYYFLAGFSLELSFKCVVMATGGTEGDIRAFGHDLTKGYDAAMSAGYSPRDKLWLGRMVDSMGPPHRGFELRYVPDVDRIDLPRADLLLKILADHIDDIEVQFDVWGDLADAPNA